MLVCCRDDVVRSVDLRMNQTTASLQAEGFKVGADHCRCTHSPDGQFAVCGSNDGSVYAWSLASSRPEKVVLREHRYAHPVPHP